MRAYRDQIEEHLGKLPSALDPLEQQADNLFIQDVAVGTGADAVSGKTLDMRYTGRLVTDGALKLGLRPVLAGRNAAKLAALGSGVVTISGDISTEAEAARLWDDAAAASAGAITDAVISVNAANKVQPIADWSAGAGDAADLRRP